MKHPLILIAILTLLATLHPAKAQQVPGIEAAVKVLKSLREGGGRLPYSFDIKYTYANESKPSQLLDSVAGKIEVSGNNYYSLLDGTEMIRNEKFSIVLFSEDKLMYIGKSTGENNADPLAGMQNILEKSGAVKCNIIANRSLQTIDISFKPDAVCKWMKMIIDTASNHLMSVEYLVKTTMLMDTPDDIEKAAIPEYDEYALVRAQFFNYHPLQADAGRFDNTNYFYKEDREFKPADRFSDYTIVLATPNL